MVLGGSCLPRWSGPLGYPKWTVVLMSGPLAFDGPPGSVFGPVADGPSMMRLKVVWSAGRWPEMIAMSDGAVLLSLLNWFVLSQLSEMWKA